MHGSWRLLQFLNLSFKIIHGVGVKKDSAEALMTKLLELSQAMDRVCSLIDQLESEEEKKELRRGMSGMLADVYTELMLPIIRQFPELDPDK